VDDLLIPSFLAAGFVFGLFTYSHRHLFGEGPPKRPAGQHPGPQDGPQGRLLWAAVATFLWPILLVGGLHGLWRLYAARRS
jgi:hypothetical protein